MASSLSSPDLDDDDRVPGLQNEKPFLTKQATWSYGTGLNTIPEGTILLDPAQVTTPQQRQQVNGAVSTTQILQQQQQQGGLSVAIPLPHHLQTAPTDELFAALERATESEFHQILETVFGTNIDTLMQQARGLKPITDPYQAKLQVLANEVAAQNRLQEQQQATRRALPGGGDGSSSSTSSSSSSTSPSSERRNPVTTGTEPQPPQSQGSSGGITNNNNNNHRIITSSQHKLQQQLEHELGNMPPSVTTTIILTDDDDQDPEAWRPPPLPSEMIMVPMVVDLDTYYPNERQMLLRLYHVLATGRNSMYHDDHDDGGNSDDTTTATCPHVEFWKDQGNKRHDYHCQSWRGVTCGTILAQNKQGPEVKPFPMLVVQEINLTRYHHHAHSSLNGTISGQYLSKLPFLKSLDLSGHQSLHGPVPFHELSKLQYLETLLLQNNSLTGALPPYPPDMDERDAIVSKDNDRSSNTSERLVLFPNLVEFNVAHNALTGPIMVPNDRYMPQVQVYDVSDNLLSGPMIQVPFPAPDTALVPVDEVKVPNATSRSAQQQHAVALRFFLCSNNAMTGTIPDFTSDEFPDLITLDVSCNLFSGRDAAVTHTATTSSSSSSVVSATGAVTKLLPEIPTSLWDLLLFDNRLSGPYVITKLWGSSYSNRHSASLHLQMISLSYNQFTGRIPINGWHKLRNLGVLMMDHNQFTGIIPVALLTGQATSLGLLDISHNKLTGTIATEIALMNSLHTIDAMSNQLTGPIPNEMIHMNPNLRLNFTANFLTGTIPSLFCGHGASSMNMLYREFGCDAVLCRPGTFNLHGHATLHSACRPCSAILHLDENDDDAYLINVLGRTTCDGLEIVNGDVNGDGMLSPREILRLIYVDTLGRFWGPTYQSWADTEVNECDLLGITCINGEVARIDLSNAVMCSNGEGAAGPTQYCSGIPIEIGMLTTLEVLLLKSQPYLRGSIPTEIGNLKGLRLLDISSCTSMTGTLPSEIGKLTKLKRLLLSHSGFRGSIPSEIMSLSGLEKLHLTNNHFHGTIPTIRKMKSIREFMIARNSFSGTIPSKIGYLTSLENFEAYHNQFTGSLPKQLALTNLKRIDVFGNKITGTIPEEFTQMKALQILHLKGNLLTGTINEGFAYLPELSWLDVSQNHLVGTIPVAFVQARRLVDFRVAGNMLYGDIPLGLCHNPTLNSGATKQYGCSGLLCPPDTYSELGYEKDDIRCLPCPEDQTSFYLGSLSCIKFEEQDILSMLYDVLDGPSWPDNISQNWNDYSVPVCDWAGIECDEDGQTIGLSLPLSPDL